MGSINLKKEISLTGALSTVMGTVIGAGVFFKTAAVVSQTQAAGSALFAWLLAGLLTMCAGLTVAELATAIPETGGPVQYIEVIYGKLPAFLLGWAQSVIYYPANIAALSIIFSTQLIHLFQLNEILLLPIAIFSASSVTLLNLLGTKIASTFQSLSLVIKLLPITAIVLFGLFQPGKVPVSLVDLSIQGDKSWAVGFSGALLATLFAYDGWLSVANIAGEMKYPQRDLPKAIIFGISFVTIIYWVINFVFLRVLPIESLAGNLNSSSDVAQILFGPSGGKIVTIGILISVYGAINGYTMTGIRVPYAMAVKGDFPFSSHLKKLSRKTTIPYVAALTQLILACVMMLFGSFDLLTDMLIFVMWVFNLLLFIGVFVFRKKEPEKTRPYRVPLYPWIPLLAILGGFFILVMTTITMTKLVIIGLGITALGIPVYYYIQRKHH